MKCLHICNDFSKSKVHKNLYSQLDNLGLEQIIFNPIRKNTPLGNNSFDFKTANSKIIYSKMLKKYHRILFRKKINFLFNELDSKYDLASIDITHATTLFSDGAIALKIYKKYKIPYIVAARGTDISLFFKYRPDLIFLLKEILLNASKIIFISAALNRTFLNHPSIKSIKSRLLSKILVIGNGIDNFWLSNLKQQAKLKPNKILYIGRFDGNKNTLSLIEGVLKLKSEFPDLKLDLVGFGGGNEERVIELSNQHNDFIQYHGAIHDKEELQKVYLSNHIFAMPSHSETFGLVYLEALSQGLPILCSKNQGVDGSLEAKIGEFVNPKSIDSISEGLRNLITEYNSYELSKIDFSLFYWENIANTYMELFSKASQG